jgi:hypothetical protein
MRWSVVVPGALIPAPIAADVIGAALRAGPLALTERLTRACIDPAVDTPAATEGAAHLDWLWRRFAGRQADPLPVTAPFAWRALDAGGLPPGALWQADPVHFAFARDHLLLTPLRDLDDAEADALAQEAQPLLQAAGARFHRRGHHGFIAFDRRWSLTALPLVCALGESVQTRLPEGDDGIRWRRLLTEVQIAWHHHPVNAARESRGAPQVNGLWLHGGVTKDGAAPAALPATTLAQVVADDPAVRGWALAAGVPAAAVRTDGAPAETTGGGDALVVWPHLFEPARAEAWGEWLPLLTRFDRWLDAQLSAAQARGAEVELVLCGRLQTRRVLITRSDRWRAWRSWRAAPAHAAFAERID